MKALATRLPRAARFLIVAAVLMLGSYGAYRLRAASTRYEPTFLETAQTDRASYASGETVVVTGSGYAPSSAVTVRVTLPDASVVDQVGNTDELGNLSFSFTPGALNGKYLLNVVGANDFGLSGVAFTYGPTLAANKGDYRAG